MPNMSPLNAEHVLSSLFRQTYSDKINQTAYQGTRWILNRHNKPFAMVCPMQDAQKLNAVEAFLQSNQTPKDIKKLVKQLNASK